MQIEKFEKDFVTHRRKELERFLKRVLNTKDFIVSEDVCTFITANDEDFSRAKEHKVSKKGFFSSVAQKITNVQVSIGKPEEIDEWFDQQKGYLQTLETQYQVLLNKSIAITKKGKDVSSAWNDIGQTSSLLTTAEAFHDKVLSKWFDKFSEISTQLASSERELAENQCDNFEDVLSDYLRLMTSIKDTLNNRNIALHQYQSAVKTRESKHEKMHKNPDDPKATEDYNNAFKKEEDSRADFEKISNTVRNELNRFYSLKHKELSRAIHELVRHRIDYHLKSADLWKEMLSTTQED